MYKYNQGGGVRVEKDGKGLAGRGNNTTSTAFQVVERNPTCSRTDPHKQMIMTPSN